MNKKRTWKKVLYTLKQYYLKILFSEISESELIYLKNAFFDIENLWIKQYKSIKNIRCVIISEAPLWGKSKKYIYNPNINDSQFFRISDLAYIMNKAIYGKENFIKELNTQGIIFIDIFPFALNEKDTKINYRNMKEENYKLLLNATIRYYFFKKLKLIRRKKIETILYLYRYQRIKKICDEIVKKTMLKTKLLIKNNVIDVISKQGGNLDKIKLKRLL